MASVIIANSDGTIAADVDYSLVDGRVRSLGINGETVYDEEKGIAVEGWKKRLVELVKEQGLNDGSRRNNRERGFHAFVHRLVEDNELEFVDSEKARNGKR